MKENGTVVFIAGPTPNLSPSTSLYPGIQVDGGRGGIIIFRINSSIIYSNIIENIIDLNNN